jgi:glycosyltransferase involved in cell wall biosynthesis
MTTDAVGGVWTYSTALARTLCDSGYEVTLVTMGPAPRLEQLAAVREIEGLHIEVTDLALEWVDPEGDDIPRARDELLRIAAHVQPHLVHLNGYREALYGFDAPVLVVAHSCVGSWWEACRSGVAMEAKWRPYLDHVGQALDAADAWVTPTHAHRAWMEKFYGPSRNGEVIWNGIAPMQAPAQKHNVVFAAGRVWDEAKNLSALARVAPTLSWPVRLAGPLQDESGGTLALQGVEQLGHLPHAQLLEEMRQAAIFVAPALYEPFGLGVLEAAANGCALVLSDIPTFRELWHGHALFVDPHNDEALARAIARLCHGDELRNGLQRKAEKCALRYSLKATANDYRALYDRLMPTLQPRATRAPAYAEARR